MPQVLHGGERPPLSLALLAMVVSVALATAAIYPLKQIAPVVSLSVVYLVPVLLVSSIWGLIPGLATSLLSAACFNFFHIAPVGRFTIADSRNWVALGAFVVVALVSSGIAEIARARSAEAEQRRAEADLAAALARELLAGTHTQQALAGAAHRIAAALGLSSAAVELGALAGDARREAIPLHDTDGSLTATLLVPSGMPSEVSQVLHTRVVPALEVLVAIALRRDQIQAEAVQTEALRRSDEVKTALLRTVSHDLRTPLTAIVAAGHALSSPSLTDEDRSELADAVVSEGERLSSLVEKLLDLSRLQSGGAHPAREWVSLEDVVLAARDALALPEAEVHITMPPDLPAVRADAVQLERVFANLLENAHRYAPDGPIFVNAKQTDSKVIVNVVDQGPGIAEADMQRIFEPFYRAPSAGSSHWIGSGLGLAIARGFVEAGGGTLTAKSLPGQGTTFSVTLPVVPPA
ncbi:MAG TPA: ATP-binding protein [Solirubrobacteraceae bacterium]|nr:ATP-binding protein [Solirubrobacteraceae bacterium]